MDKKTRKYVFIIVSCLLCSNILAWLAVWDLSQPHFLKVNFFNVGQGDAIFIDTPQRHQILIDGGPNSAILEKLGKEMPFWDRTLDLIILTHPEKDHLAGLLEVLKRYKVENILWTGVVRSTFEYKQWLKSIQNEKAKIKIAKAGQQIITSKTILKILFPVDNLGDQEFRDSNNTSIVSRLIFNQKAFIFTGDIYKSAERKLIEKFNVNSQVLKVSHHGSKTSTSEEFLKQVSPQIAIIQVGKDNSYGHPHSETLETLNKYDIKILRTDLDGDIKIISDGNKLKIKNNYSESVMKNDGLSNF